MEHVLSHSLPHSPSPTYQQDMITENHFAAAPAAIVGLFERLVHYYIHSMHTIVATYSRKIGSRAAPSVSVSKTTPAPQLSDPYKHRSEYYHNSPFTFLFLLFYPLHLPNLTPGITNPIPQQIDYHATQCMVRPPPTRKRFVIMSRDVSHLLYSRQLGSTTVDPYTRTTPFDPQHRHHSR